MERSRMSVTHDNKVLEEKLDHVNATVEQYKGTIDQQNEKIKVMKESVNELETRWVNLI